MAGRIIIVTVILTLALQGRGQEESCPDHCSCSPHLTVVTCIKQKLTKIPEGIPVSTRELYLGENLLVGLDDHAFASLINLKKLYLNNNFLASGNVHVGAFLGLYNLQELHLTRNRLTNVSGEWFKDMASLTHAYFSQNMLTQIPDMGHCVALTKLGIDNNNIQSAQFPESYTHLSELSTIILSNNKFITNFTHSDVRYLESSDIRKIDLSRCPLTKVDPYAFTVFPHLQSLSLSYIDSMNMITIKNILSGLSGSQLSSLDLSHSVKHSIPADLFDNFALVPLITLDIAHMTDAKVIANGTFKHLTKLIHLDMSFSRLNLIEDGAFDQDNMKLKTLNLNSNILNLIPNDLPKSLLSLDLTNNGAITSIPKLQFSGLTALQNITFKNCGIREIDSNAFVGMAGLRKMDLSHNNIADIGLNVFKPLANLHSLSLKGNKLAYIPTEAKLFQPLSSLQSLDMSDNHCYNLPKTVFNPLLALQRLDLSDNSLGHVIAQDDGTLFHTLRNLTSLHIERSELIMLPLNLFKSLVSLNTLNLSSNKIFQWAEGVFNGTKQLINADLSNNRISIVNKTSVVGLPDSVRLDLSANPFACWCDLIWFRGWMDDMKNTSKVILLNTKNYTCNSPESMLHKKVIDFHPETILRKCFPPPWMYIVIGSSCGAAGLIIAIVVVIYRYRWPIRLRLYYLGKKCKSNKPQRGGYTTMQGDDELPRYDVLVSYGPSEQDCQWVKRTLIPKIDKQSDGQWNIFFEERDAMFNETVIGQIADAIWNSRKVMLVISKEYLQDSRRAYEVELALSSLEDKGLPMKDTIILVLLDDRESVNIPHALHPIMNNDNGLHWTDNKAGKEYFWNALNEKIGTETASFDHIRV